MSGTGSTYSIREEFSNLTKAISNCPPLKDSLKKIDIFGVDFGTTEAEEVMNENGLGNIKVIGDNC